MKRESVLRFYKWLGPAILLITFIFGAEDLGLIDLAEQSLARSTIGGYLYTLIVLIEFAMGFGLLVAPIFCAVVFWKLRTDWPVTLPALALLLPVASVILQAATHAYHDITGPVADGLFAAGFLLFGLTATWSGWRSRSKRN